MRVEINEVLFKQMIDGVRHCVSKDEYRPVLKYIQIEVRNDTVTAYALDGYRAAKTQIKLSEPSENEFLCYIKPFSFKPLKQGINPVVIETDGSCAFVEVITEFGKVRYSFEKPDGNFDIAKVFEDNKDHDRELGMNAFYMAQACGALQKITNDRRTNLVVLETKENNLRAFIIRAKGEGITSEQLILPVRFTEKKEDAE